jgi:hypothetical protein
LLAAAIGTLLPVGAAYALDILGNKFADPMSGSRADVDTNMYGRIEFLGNTIPTARQGAEGPVRTETMADGYASAKPEQNQKLNILGNTFWLPGKE